MFPSTKLLGAALLAATMATPARAIDLADEPLFSTTSAVPGNLILALSVEWPTATTPAYPSTTAYAASSTFLGYFDPGKCYLYKYDSSTPSNSYFAPYGSASSHACSSSASLPLWSGNYLNWASMQTLDAFRWVLTGGYRSVDTTTETLLTKTYAERDASVIPQKTLAVGSTDDPIAAATPFKGSVWTSGVTTRVRALGTRMWITSTNTGSTAGTVGTASKDTTGATAYTSQNSYVASSNDSYAKPGVTYELYINLKVCDASVGLESNCKPYGSNYKPEGLMQAYATKLRYSAFGYLNHSGDTTQQRDGGVMRARMKYIGPTQPVPGSTATSNSAAEWDASTGIMVVNPDTADATATQTLASSAGWSVSIANSGVMNYLNKFGYSAKGYKSKDPVSEMVQAALRYYRNLGHVASYSDLSGAGSSSTAAAWLDGFPAITSWSDPIAYSCQRNFILGIGDVNTHRDANLYGSTLRSGLEPTLPAAVAADTAVNVKTATDMVGQLEGLKGTAALGDIYAATSSTTCADTGQQCNTYYLAGLAYDAHTRDLRSDLTGAQTVNTYWMDVLEGQVYKHKNQYWLAAKYGGFTLPDGFSPYASSNGPSTLADSSWRTNTDTLAIGTTSLTYSTDGSTSTDVRPDNYFPGDRPDLMKSGLTNAFAKISSELKATTSTAFAIATADVASGDASYAAGYDPKNWTGTLTGSRVAYDASGTPSVTTLWNARTLLDARTATGRVIVTCCDSAGAALPFQAATLAAATLSSRTTYTSFASVSGVSSQSAANYLAWLRGDRTQEAANGGPYRSRSYLLGDIAGGRINPVGAPAAPYYDSYNPGYSSFRKAYAGRKTVVYAGANDGMLHAFDGTVPADGSSACTSCGQELFAYIPSFVYGTSGTSGTAATSGLASLGNPSFTHHFLVDGKPLDFDLDFSKTQGANSSTPDWRTLLIGGLGKGGSGYYAIDVTDPAAWTSETAVAAKVLWEFTDTRMGYSYGAPIVVKTARYGWVAIFTSGYNNSDGKGYFFIVNPRTGALLEAVATPEGSTSAPLGMAQASVFVPDFKDFTVDAVYAGDQQGNVWRLDLTGTTAYAAPTKMASLVRDSVAQPITTRPLIEIDPASQKRYVLVGTGRLLADSDISSRSLQGFYALVDGTSASGGFYTSATLPKQYVFPLTRSQLNANTNLLTGIGSAPVSAMGWYYDLAADSTTGIAERINIDPVANQGIVAFAANLPDGVVCSPSGKTRQFAVSFASGKSVLVDETGALIGATAYRSGLTTDLAIVRVDGKLRLVAGSSSGDFFPVPGQLVSAAGLKRLNWREVPAED